MALPSRSTNSHALKPPTARGRRGAERPTGRRWSVLQRVQSFAASLAVLVILGAAASAAHLAIWIRRAFGRREVEPRGTPATLLLTGTFYNVGWFRAHILPLANCAALRRVVVVCDAPLFAVDKVTYVSPPRWAVRLLGRALARAVWVGVATWQTRPDVLMGYHIMPNALLCLLWARLCGAQAIYQMTGGPVQLVGGGVGSENVLLRQLRKPSRLREALMFHTVRQFDCVVVRGRNAAQFVRERGLARHCLIIPGSVDCERFSPSVGEKRYDLVCVGRLVPVKRCDRLVRIVAALKDLRPLARIAVVGDGPLLAQTRQQAARLGVSTQIDFLGRRDDVAQLLRQSRAFVITSETEGLSIAMIEALAVGLPVFAPNVGDLGELLRDGQNGAFIDADDAAETARTIADLLNDRGRLAQLSAEARRAAVAHSSVPAVARAWRAYFGNGAAKTESRGIRGRRAAANLADRKLRSFEARR